jgi:hypothetical protein
MYVPIFEGSNKEEEIITYLASKMILYIHSNAGYCNKKNARSRAGRHFPLSNNNQFPPNKGAIVIGHGIGGKVISAKMAQLAES